MKPLLWKKINYICLGAAFLLLGISMLIPIESIQLLVASLGAFLSVGSAVGMLIFWRCPSCGKLLPKYGVGKIQCCPYCSMKLDDSEKNEDG